LSQGIIEKQAGDFAFMISRMAREGAAFPGKGQKDASCDHLSVMAFKSAEPPKKSGRA
jgi:hypothetical protein